MALKPEFISLLRDIRDRIYPELDNQYNEVDVMYQRLLQMQQDVDVVYADIRTIESNIESIQTQIHGISIGTVNTVPVNPDGSHGIANADYNPLTSKFDFSIPAGSNGIRGLKGDTGAQGVQGTKGDQGVQGLQGVIGAAGPTGAEGSRGPAGIEGPKGNTGAQGVTGNTGVQGLQGHHGADGMIGPQGPAGTGIDIKGHDTVSAIKLKPSGIVGESWIATDTGLDDDGLSVLVGHVLRATGAKWISIGPIEGPAGAQGAKGDNGDQGIEGPTGIQGDQGIQGDKGEQGDEGPKGIQGIKGDEGPQGIQGEAGGIGAQGEQGIAGEKGDKGDTGPKGDTGATGLTGNTGPKGDKGDIGLTGLKGDKGDQGNVGPAGQMTLQRLEFLATANQKIFAITYAIGVHLQVIQNGLTLDKNKYTANSGTDVVLNTGASAGDIVQIWTYKEFNVADMYTKAESDAKYALKTEHYTMLQVDDKFAEKTKVYTKSQSDGKYLVISGVNLVKTDKIASKDGSNSIDVSKIASTDDVQPNGGITSGSTANGDWTKYPDGTLMCWTRKKEMSYVSSSLWNYTWTYPVAFTEEPIVTITPDVEYNTTECKVADVQHIVKSITLTNVQSRIYSRAKFVNSFGHRDKTVHSLLAIGRWK